MRAFGLRGLHYCLFELIIWEIKHNSAAICYLKSKCLSSHRCWLLWLTSFAPLCGIEDIHTALLGIVS